MCKFDLKKSVDDIYSDSNRNRNGYIADKKTILIPISTKKDRILCFVKRIETAKKNRNSLIGVRRSIFKKIVTNG